jgi:hypothetical protein
MSHRPYPSWERALNQLWRHCAPRLIAAHAADRNALADFVFDAHPDLRELDSMLDNAYRTDGQ